MTVTRDELAAAQRAIALAPQPEKYRVLEREAMSIGTLVQSGKVEMAEAVDALCHAGLNNGLSRANVEHIVGRGLQGIVTLTRSAAERGADVITGVGTAAALQRRDFAPLKFVVQEVLPEGLTLLAGAPKIGKSWLALDMAIAVAAGHFCLGDRCVDQGEVLYLALEDGERRLQRRLRKLIPEHESWPASFHFATEWPKAEEGIARIEQWCGACLTPRLVVIDVLEKFRRASSDRNVYARDYGDLSPLQKLATQRSVAILVVHHTRKGASDATVERISGTLALPGAADAYLVLDRGSSGATLIGSGRDAGDVDLAVQFNRDTCRWTVLGHAADIRRASERGRVLDFLHGEAAGVGPSDVAAELGLSPANAKQLLRRMAKAAEVVRIGRGLYFHPERVTSVTLSPSQKRAAGMGVGDGGDKVTEVTPPAWQLPLLSVRDGSG